jgi:hypothetical protein
MKRHPILLISFLLLAGVAQAGDENPLIYIQTRFQNRQGYGNAEAIASYLETRVWAQIEKEFPCAKLSSDKIVGIQLDFARQRALLGTEGSGNDIANIAGAVGGEYVVGLNIVADNKLILLSASCMYTRRAEMVTRSIEIAGSEGAAMTSADKLAKDFVKGMAYFEICRYHGPVNVTVHTTLKDEHKEEHGVYCNHSDQVYKKTSSITKTVDTAWKLNKTGKANTVGEVDHKVFEEMREDEEDGCHKCASGREGGRIYNRTETVNATVHGLSQGSSTPGETIKDARIEIIFKQDGTYFLHIKAATDKGEINTRIVEKAEGTCDMVNKSEAHPRELDVPLENIWGPFKGTPLDKILKDQKEEKEPKNAAGEEKVTKLDFELSRK